MTTKTLDSAPGTIPLYVRAALPMIPLASKLPWISGGGKDMPDLAVELKDVAIDAAAVADYAKVCGFCLRDTVPPSYPHVLAFPLQMALMVDPSFPFPAIGLVHVENTISVHRPIRVGERLDLAVRPTEVKPHPKGKTFAIVSEARAGGELVWKGTSTMLRRGSGDDSAPEKTPRGTSSETPVPGTAEWRLPGDLGRRYARVSGDTNPIHISDLTAKAFGFPRAIAHGMWTKARCLAALDNRLPESFTVSVAFKKPILLPATVSFGSVRGGDTLRFAVRDARKDTPHLEGSATWRA